MVKQASNTTATQSTWWLRDRINRFLFVTNKSWMNPLIPLACLAAFSSVTLLPQYIESYINKVRWIVEVDSSWSYSKTTRYVCSKAIWIICGREVTTHYPWKEQVLRIWDVNTKDYNLPSDEEVASFIGALRKIIEENPELNNITIEWKYNQDWDSELGFFSNKKGLQANLSLERAKYIKAKIEEQAPELIPLVSRVFSRSNITLISDLEYVIYPIMEKYWISDFQDFIEKYNKWEIVLEDEWLSEYAKMRLRQIYDSRIEVIARDSIWHDTVETYMSPDLKRNIPLGLISLLILLLYIHNGYKWWLHRVSRLLDEAKKEERDELERNLFGDKLEEFRRNNIIFSEKLKEVKEWDIIIISETKDYIFWYQKINWIWKKIRQRHNISKIVNWEYWVYDSEENNIEDEYELFLAFHNYEISPENLRICTLSEFNNLTSKKIKKD